MARDASTAAQKSADTARATARLVRFAPVLGIVLVLPSLVWAALDRSIWPWDPAWYGSVSLDLAATRSDGTSTRGAP